MLFRSLVGPFYKENISLLFFLFIVMIGVVGEDNGAEIWQYHYSLALAMLQNAGYLLFVFAAWLLYTRKCALFVSGLLKQPDYSFITGCNSLKKARRFLEFLWVAVWLLLPIVLYGLFVIVYGGVHHFYFPIVVVAVFLCSLCICSALWFVYILDNRYKEKPAIHLRLPFSSSYGMILLRQVAQKQKIMWLAFKLFTCGVLYGIALNNTTPNDYETVSLFLFFNFGVLANGVIVFGLREFEESRLFFYRAVPVPLLRRLAGYALAYFVLLIPEFITTFLLVPVHLHFGDALLFSLCAYGLVLLMNSITFLGNFSRKEYLFLLLMVFCIEYIFLGGIGLSLLCGLLFAAAIAAFLAGYYRFERAIV